MMLLIFVAFVHALRVKINIHNSRSIIDPIDVFLLLLLHLSFLQERNEGRKGIWGIMFNSASIIF